MIVSEGPIPYPKLAAVRTLLPLGIIAASAVTRIPPIKRALDWAFTDTYPLSAVPSNVEPAVAERKAAQFAPAGFLHPLLGFLSGMELLAWTIVFGDELALAINTSTVDLKTALLAGGMVIVWLFLTVRTVVHPPVTPPGSSLLIYAVLCAYSVAVWIDVGNARLANGEFPVWATQQALIFETANLTTTLMLVLLASQLRFSSPIVLARAPQLGMDDTATFWQWITFSWVSSFIKYTASNELTPEELPKLSPTQQTANTFRLLQDVVANTLLRKLALANRFDVFVDLSLTFVSVCLNYLSPFFLGKILTAISHHRNGHDGALAQAYTFAFLAFLASVSKSVFDLIHLWACRRASVRIKGSLIAALCDKALRRKDASGVINPKEEETSNVSKDGKDVAKDGKDGKDGKEEKKTNANAGKVVNLMSGDANRIAMTVSFLNIIYANPIEITVACTLLYGLLGWSAFAGVIAVVIATPINSWISRRAVGIQKDLLKARDKRINVMNELIGAITFIKFFAWTEKWEKRASDARKGELKQMIRSILNNLMFSLLWSLVPIMVSLLSFFCFIVIAKEKLTVAIAFESIALFSMLRMPLNSIPMFIVWILQSKVALGRIQSFLEEEEVPDWVSSLKRHEAPSSDSKIGFTKATLRWNAGDKDKTENGQAGENGNGNGASSPDAEGPESSSVESVPEVFELSNVTVDFPLGKLTVVTGPTGAGKTAILTGLLGEMDIVQGETHLPKYLTQVDPTTGLRNSVAYAAQTPWLQQKTIKDNILFGEQVDEERYEACVDACALRTDFDILEDGDQTEIGAKGVSLSGGQKARVALARAVYSFAQHVLLDDPLAAVDSHTAKHLVDKCLNGPLLKGRTVILVSHHLDLLLPTADYIVRILDGRVDCQGAPEHLRETGDLDGVVAVEEAEVTKLEIVSADNVVDEIEGEEDDSKKTEKKKGPGRKLVKDEERAVGNVKWHTYKLYIQASTYITLVFWVITLVLSQLNAVAEWFWLRVWGEAYNTQVTNFFSFGYANSLPDKQLSTDYHHHFIYHSQNNVTAAPGFVVQGADVGSIASLPSADTNPGFYLGVYAAIMLGSAFVSIIQSIVGAWGGYRAGKTLHDRLLDSVIHSTIRFFNTTPLGRILSACFCVLIKVPVFPFMDFMETNTDAADRFSKDIETIDTRLSGSLRTVAVYGAALLVRLGVVAYIVPSFLIPAAFMSYLYYSYALLYLRAGRSFRRLEATSNSPIFSGFAELLDGVITVRAFSAESRFFETMCVQVDQALSAFYYYWMSNRWLMVRIDVLGGASVFITTLMVLRAATTDGSAGVAISAASGLVQSFYWLSRFWGEMEMDLNSVERVEEYLNIPQEPPSVIEGSRPPAYWPSYSTTENFISAQDLEIKYSPELPTVFKGSFDIKASEKIGLIGRTGSGKSTLAMSLLRFTDPASGKLFIDGIDVTSIGVDDLRSRITYIPQDAVLFSGTVRDNLDPFGEHTDADLLDALERVNLVADTAPASRMGSRPESGAATPVLNKSAPTHPRLVAIAAENAADDSASGRSSGLHTPRLQITLASEVSAGGTNFSQGQRQLVAMARALLRRSNLIIMDEATASVDFATDEAIQQAIRSEFKESTLITIAHRLSSIIDYDRLLVLSDGGVAEFDTPMNLLRKDTSLFKSLCEKSGKYTQLYKAAERKEKQLKGEVEVEAEASPASVD